MKIEQIDFMNSYMTYCLVEVKVYNIDMLAQNVSAVFNTKQIMNTLY